MGTATPGAMIGLLLVFLILAILPLILLRRDSLDHEGKQKKSNDFPIALKKHDDERYDAAGSCDRSGEDGYAARLEMNGNTDNESSLLLSCPSCGSVFRANSA